MARFNLDQDRYNAWGQDTWVHPDEERFWQEQQGGQDEVPVLLRCPVCLKDLRARELCAACGDDVERDGPDADGSCPRSGGSSVPATVGQGPSSPCLVPVSLSAREEAA